MSLMNGRLTFYNASQLKEIAQSLMGDAVRLQPISRNNRNRHCVRRDTIGHDLEVQQGNIE